MEQYSRQNKLQKTMRPIVESFFPNRILGKLYSFETYSPRISRVKIVIFVGGAVGCFVTPLTNWLVFPLARWVLK